MDKIDMSLDDIIKQNRKENRKQALLKKKASANLKNRPSGPAGQKQGKKAGQVKGGLQVKGRAGQLKQFRARIGGKKTLGKGVALQRKKGAAQFQQQGAVVANRGPARQIGKQRLPVKRNAGAQVLSRYRKQQQQQQQQQRLQQNKAARQKQFNQQRGIQMASQTLPVGNKKKVKLTRQNFNTQPNRQRINVQTNRQPQQLNRRQRQRMKRTQQIQPAPRANVIRAQRQNNQRIKALKMNTQKAQRVMTQKVNPKLLTVSINNPRAMQSYKPVKINRNKPKAQISSGTLSDRFTHLQQQTRNAPNTNKRRRRQKQSGQGQNNSGRTVLLV